MRKERFVVTMMICASIIGAGTWFVSAGSLTPPPGPVAGTMVSLSDIHTAILSLPAAPDPRIDVSTLPGIGAMFTIGMPGSYYLTSNIVGIPGTAGIEIAADNVTLDLNGFALTGGPGTLSGVIVSFPGPTTNLEIRNGSISAWDGDGVFAPFAGVGPVNVTLEDLRVSDNFGGGIVLSVGAGVEVNGIIRNVISTGNGGPGIVTGDGFHISDSVASLNGGDGFDLGAGSVIVDSVAAANGFSGIVVSMFPGLLGIGGTVSNCVVSGNGMDGIASFGGCHIFENRCSGNGTGIFVFGPDNTIERNHCFGNLFAAIDTGVAGPNVVVSNRAPFLGGGYLLAPADTFGPIVGPGFVASPAGALANILY